MTRILMLMLLLPASVTAQMAPGPVEVVDGFHAALEAGDREAALGYLAPEVIIFEGGGAEMSRDEYASHHLGGDMAFLAAMEQELLDRQDHVAGDLAYVLSRTRTRGSFREREVDSTGVETMVLERRDDGWRIVHIHWSSRPSPTEE